MKKIYTLLVVMLFSSYSFSQLIITELADPNNNSGARYVEIYNQSASDVDLTDWELRRWTNGNAGPQNTGVDLSSIGILSSGSFVIISPNAGEFENVYGFAPDIDAGTGGAADSNGDDQIAIFDASDNTIDIFGVPGEDGSGTCHEFEDGRAERIASVSASNPVWEESEWNVWADSQVSGCTSHTQQPINTGDGIYDPGVWIGESSDEPTIVSSVSELDGFIQFVGTPSPEQTLDVSGTNLTSDISVSVSGDYEISLTSSTGFSTSLLLTSVSGELTSTTLYIRLNGSVLAVPSNGSIVFTSAGADNLSVNLSGEILNPDPVLFSSEDTLIGFSHFVGAPSTEQTFVVSGNYLTEDITVDVSGDYEISSSSAGTFSNSLLLPNIGGQVQSAEVFVRLNGASQNYSQEGIVTISSQSQAVSHTVNSGNYYYQPQLLTVNVGDTVYWINDGGFHNVNFITNSVSGENYNNPESFASTPTSDSEMYFHIFTLPGTYEYDCSVGSHAANGMVGTITVVAGSSPESKTIVLSGETLDYLSTDIANVTTNDSNLLADSIGVYVSLQGVVHCIDFDGNEGLSFTMIDSDNNGINVYNFVDVSDYVVTEGDEIRVLGQIDQFNGLIEVFADSIEVLSTENTLQEPTIVTDLNEDTESQLIRIENVSFVDPIATFPSGSNNIDVTDGDNIFTLRIDGDTDIPEGAAPQGLFDVTGIGGQYDSSSPYDSGYQLFPCGLASFEPVSTSGITENIPFNVGVFPNPFSNEIEVAFSSALSSSLVVRDMQGRIIHSQEVLHGDKLSTLEWPNGVYLFTFEDGLQQTQTLRLIK